MQRTHDDLTAETCNDCLHLGVTMPVLTIPEVACALRCSKAHVHNLINGKVRGAKPLPSVRMGRRRLIMRSSLEAWIEASEKC